MRSQGRFHCFIAAFILLSIAAPNTLLASDTEIIVNNATGAECSTTATPPCYTTIQTAIDYANNVITSNTGTSVTFSILVGPGTFSEAITLKAGVSIIQGGETARTILHSSGSGPVVSASNLSSAVSIRHFSFINTAAGIMVSNCSSAINITNNIFYGTSGTAVAIQGSPSANVINNTFYLNGSAISRDAASNQITNNIFSNNTTAHISGALFPADQSNITYNDFFIPTPNASEITDPHSIPNLTTSDSNPDFVDTDISHLDFHLQTGSPCIINGDPNQGTPPDMGAYGGTNADTIPKQVVSSVTGTTSTSISLAWNANLSYSVTGYRVYYGQSPGLYNGTDAIEGPSPISMPSTTITSAMISGLTAPVVTPAKPKLNDKPTVLNESLVLSWDAVPGATGYRVYADSEDGTTTTSPPTTLKADNVNSTSYTLTGLTNNVKYKIAVSAIAQATYYVAVTAVNSIPAGASSSPGIAYESAYSEVVVPLSDPQESVQSDFIVEFPEGLAAYPNLQSSHVGCFIATAAFGSSSDPEVQTLRVFRDRYLLTSGAGKAFVRWYYENAPAAASWLNAHPGFKPAVRAALMPAVGLALFMTDASSFIKAIIGLLILLIVLMTAYRLFRKRLSGSGEAPCR